MNLYYENHLGERIYFYRSPYVLTEHTVFDWTLAYSTVRNRSLGFRLDPVERTAMIRILPKAATRLAREAYFANLYDKLVNVFSADVDVPGKLWTDTGEYLECRFIASGKSAWNIPRNVSVACQVLIDYPKWQKPTTYTLDALFGSGGSGSSDSSDLYPFLNYPHGYLYDYKGTYPAQKTVNNGGTESADYILTINGPVTNPKIIVNGIPIGAYVTLGTDEQLEIDTKNKTVVKVSNGDRLNVFNKRYKGDSSIFEKLPLGDIGVMWDGYISAEITVLSERIEPKWS